MFLFLLLFFFSFSFRIIFRTGEKPFECDICKRRFREQSDLRKHKKVHNNVSTARCTVCNRNQPSSRHSTKCVSCEKEEATKRYHDSISVDLVQRTVNDANNKRAFVCKYCDRAFGSSSNLKRHVMITFTFISSFRSICLIKTFFFLQ